MDADNMFEELEFLKYENKEKTKEIYIFNGLDRIVFDKELKIVEPSTAGLPMALNMQELKAITKKCEEYGWLGD